jgi:cytochrome b pre-mRNA-processing protein 3
MKDYINLFHSMVSEIHFWNNLSRTQKIEKFSIFLSDFNKIDDLLDYFEDFNEKLSKKTLSSSHSSSGWGLFSFWYSHNYGLLTLFK